MWDGNKIAGENTGKHGENMQAPQRNAGAEIQTLNLRTVRQRSKPCHPTFLALNLNSSFCHHILEDIFLLPIYKARSEKACFCESDMGKKTSHQKHLRCMITEIMSRPSLRANISGLCSSRWIDKIFHRLAPTYFRKSSRLPLCLQQWGKPSFHGI